MDRVVYRREDLLFELECGARSGVEIPLEVIDGDGAGALAEVGTGGRSEVLR